MKTVLAFLLALVASSSFAAAVPLTPGPGIAGTASGFTTASSFTGQFSAASFNSNFTANVGGKAVTMPATMRMAANAGQFAVSAVRLNPAGLIGGAVASWLLSQGIQYINGQFQKTEPLVGYEPGYMWCMSKGTAYEVCGAEPAGVCSKYFSSQPPDWRGSFIGCNEVGRSAGGVTYGVSFSNYYYAGVGVEKYTDSCAAGTRYVTGMGCIGLAVPLTDADWAAIPQNQPLPDPVAGELAAKGVPLPLEVPHIAPQDIPLSDPYVDPVTGKRYRDQARITPSSDAKTADVQATKQEVDEAGNPKKQDDGQTDKPPEEQTDFCKKNPDAIACMPEGQTDDQELQTKNIGSGISPISVGGQGQCMADKTLSMATMGKSITFTYKPICDLASMVRPLILAIAWLLAGWIMVGAVKDN